MVLLIKAITLHIPLGLLYLASELERSGHQVRILDYVIGKYTPQRFKEEIKRLNPCIVGISCFSFNARPAFEIAKMVKKTLPHAHMVMGGPHPSGLVEHTLGSECVDSVIVGEGEETLKELVEAVKGAYPLNGIKGLAYRVGEKVIVNPPRGYIKDVDNISFPVYHLIDLEAYFEFSDQRGMVTRHPRFASIFTSRGCPFSCTYCHNTLGKSFRARSPQNVVEEMELLYHKYGIREFHIEDDSFNTDIARAEKILDMIVDRKLRISLQFPNGIRADRINETFARKLKKAGTFMIALGIESASPRVLKEIKKSLDLNKISDAVDVLSKNGILVWGYFMIGFLNETRQEIWKTVDFARELRLHFASFSMVIPYPGTELFEQVRDRIDLDSYFSHRLTYSLPQIQLSEIPLEKMGEVKKRALKKFYTPGRMLRIAGRINSPKELKFYWGKFKKNILKPRFGTALRETIEED